MDPGRKAQQLDFGLQQSPEAQGRNLAVGCGQELGLAATVTLDGHTACTREHDPAEGSHTSSV